MGKKVKPKSLLENSSIKIETENIDIQSTNAEEYPNESGNVSDLNIRLKSSDQEKLEKYDALEQNVIDLTKQNELLQTKIEEYADMLSMAQSTSTIDSDSDEKTNKFKTELKKTKDDLNKAIGKIYLLEQDIKALREENDQYLMKISDLTYEVALKTSQLDELSKNIQKTGHAVNQEQFAPEQKVQRDNITPAKPFANPYNPYANNGYGSW